MAKKILKVSWVVLMMVGMILFLAEFTAFPIVPGHPLVGGSEIYDIVDENCNIIEFPWLVQRYCISDGSKSCTADPCPEK